MYSLFIILTFLFYFSQLPRQYFSFSISLSAKIKIKKYTKKNNLTKTIYKYLKTHNKITKSLKLK